MVNLNSNQIILVNSFLGLRRRWQSGYDSMKHPFNLVACSACSLNISSYLSNLSLTITFFVMGSYKVFKMTSSDSEVRVFTTLDTLPTLNVFSEIERFICSDRVSWGGRITFGAERRSVVGAFWSKGSTILENMALNFLWESFKKRIYNSSKLKSIHLLKLLHMELTWKRFALEVKTSVRRFTLERTSLLNCINNSSKGVGRMLVWKGVWSE